MSVQAYIGTFFWVAVIFWILFQGTVNVFGQDKKLGFRYRLLLGFGMPLAVMAGCLVIGVIGETMLAPLQYLYRMIM